MKKTLKFNIISLLCLPVCALLTISCKEVPQVVPNTTYKVLEVSLSNKSLTRKYSAAIKGKQSVEIRPQVSGTITEISIAEGAKVRKGQTLFIIDQTPYKAALLTAKANVESAKASVANAELTANSKEELFNQKVVSSFDLQTAKNTLLVQQAALAQARAQEINAENNLSYTVVKSPVDGVASMIPYRVGALVNASITAPLVTVSDDKEMNVYFSMTEGQILALSRQNDSLTNAMDAMPEEVELLLSDNSMYDEKGKVDAISGIIDYTTGAITIRATFDNTKGVLRSGGVGNIVFPYNLENCVVIPHTATYEIQDKIFVYKVVDGKSVSTQIMAFEVNDGKEYVVESGLQVGDIIVADGAGLLREGMTVTAAAPQQSQQ